MKIESLNPCSGGTRRSAGTIENGRLVVRLPGIGHDVAKHIHLQNNEGRVS
ncbi:MAG: hypothetical protein ACR2KU_12855 [Gammaproteobacteria bacterium]|nr:hypothetical protein [Gammaproteobacteria bacterium]